MVSTFFSWPRSFQFPLKLFCAHVSLDIFTVLDDSQMVKFFKSLSLLCFFVVMIPQFVEEVTKWLSDNEGGVTGAISDVVLTSPDGDFGVIATGTQAPGWQLNVFDWNIVLFGVLIIVFLIGEPMGLYGVWVRVRNYWKRWPFSY